MEGLIIKAISGDFTVLCDNDQMVVCKPLGIFRHKKISPRVGDYVKIVDNTIIEVKKRKNELLRPVISNVDKVFIVTSLIEPDLNLNLLDRILSQVEYADIDIVLIFSKEDLINSRDYSLIMDYYRSIGYRVYFSPSEKDLIKQEIGNCICVVAGQSGVGKSTMINMFDDFNIKTNEISHALGRGKHTTTHVELLKVNNGWIADTPGFGSLTLDMDLASLSHTFKDFFACKCKFNGCLHINEPGCKVKDGVTNKTILLSRYENYLLFVDEIKKAKPKY